MLDQKLATAMQKVLSKEDERFTLTQSLLSLIDYGIGRRQGKSAYFSAKDKEEIRRWLTAKGYSTEDRVLPGMGRHERLALTPNEKAGGEAIKQGRIAIKALKGKALMLDGTSLYLPPNTHIDANWRQILDGMGHSSIVVVENYENFDRIHETSVLMPEEHDSPLVLYRGDRHESRLDNVKAFLAEAARPVYAFVDADPAGIAIASQMSNLAAMLLPPRRFLDAQVQKADTARKDLFLSQLPVVERRLDALPEKHPCRGVWALIKQAGAGVVQERWITGQVEPFA